MDNGLDYIRYMEWPKWLSQLLHVEIYCGSCLIGALNITIKLFIHISIEYL